MTTTPVEACDEQIYGWNPRRTARYVVMPYATGYSTGDIVTRYGVLDCMFDRARWCGLPGEDGETEPLLWATLGAASEWVRQCLAARQCEGGPACFLPFGWYGGREVSAHIRADFSPWEDHPPGAPLLHREGRIARSQTAPVACCSPSACGRGFAIA